MKVRMILASLAAFSLAVAAGALTKNAGTAQCAKPNPAHMVEVGDEPNHSMGVSKSMCTWTKPLEIAGLKSKDGWSVASDDTKGSKSSSHGVHVSNMDNGDKIYVRFQGTGMMKDGAMQSDSGTWSYTSGTGKLKGIKGKGTYNGKPSADGGMTYEVKGDYTLPK